MSSPIDIEKKNIIVEYLKEKKPEIDAIIRKYSPETYSNESLEWTLGKARYSYNIKAANGAIAAPIWDLMNRGGKRWRPALFMLIVEALGGDSELVKDFVVVPELVHNGTLIIDDVEDKSTLRRGQPCVHQKFGDDVAINAGNSMYYIPLLALAKNRDKFPAEVLLKAHETYIQEMVNLGFGQGMDIWWHNSGDGTDDITENEYLQMCAFKTGCLSRMAAKLAVILSGGSDEQAEAIGKVSETIGVAFQIQDDILDVILTDEDREKFGKAFGNDIKEGKRTLMVIHAIQEASPEDRARLIEILGMHTDDENLIKEALEILAKYDSVNYAKNRAKELMQDAWSEADPLLEDSPAKEKLKAFVDYLIERDV